MNHDIVNPLVFRNWDDLLLTNAAADFFHSAAWSSVLSETYGYKPLFFTIIENDELAGLLPVMAIDSIFTGRRGVSLPFTDYCQPIAEKHGIYHQLFNKAVAFGRRAGWKTLEVRGGESFFKTTETWRCYFTHRLKLDPDDQLIGKTFRASTMRNVRLAEKAGVRVNLRHTREAMATFYDLNCKTRRRHGLPPQPWQFFKNVFKHIITCQKGGIFIATHQKRPIAAAVFFCFNRKAVYKYGASDHHALHLRPNNLIMWRAVQWFCANGFQSLHFGRTDLSHSGLRQFKAGWGTREGRLQYYKYDLKRNRFLSRHREPRIGLSAFRVMPMPLLKAAGRALYKHVG